jgi:6-phosphogluconolactonase
MNASIKVFPTPLALAESLAYELVNQVKEIKEIKEIKEAGKRISPFTIALSGGSTPKLLFSVLGDQYASSVNWNNVHFFWVDERCVSPDDSESNFGMTHKELFSKIDIPIANVHRIKGEDDPVKEAERYSNEINSFTVKRNGLPFFNIMLLGLGEDGHTASVFPGNEKLFLSDRICTVAVHPETGQKRITITGRTINNAGQIIFLVTGKSKVEIVKKIIKGRDAEKHFPASYVIPVDGRIFWYLDKAAGSLLKLEK